MRWLISSRRVGLVALTVCLVLVTSNAYAQRGGNGNGGGGGGNDGGTTTPPPPVRYQVEWKRSSDDGRQFDAVEAMNDLGVVVGSLDDNVFGGLSAFVWDASGVRGIDQLAGNAIPAGWIARSANDINNNGRIIGEVVDSIAKVTYPFVYDPTLTPPFQVLPETSRDGYGINDAGDVVYFDLDPVTEKFVGFTYDYDPADPLGYRNPNRLVQIPLVDIQTADINAAGQVIGRLLESGVSGGVGAFRYTPGASPKIETWLIGDTGIESATSINDAGWFAGYFGGESYRFGDGLLPLGRDGWNEFFRCQEINNRGDVLVGLLDGDAYYFTDDPDKTGVASGSYLIDSLVDPNDPKWFGGGGLNLFFEEFSDLNNPNAISDPAGTGFGQVCGFIEFVEETGKGKSRTTNQWREAFRMTPMAVTQ